MLRGTLLVILPAACVLAGLPALASGQDPDALFDETEPETVIEKVKASKKGTVRVFFHGSDPVDAPDALSYDCAVDPGKGGGSDESDDEDSDDEEDDPLEDLPDLPDPLAAALEYDCGSPWVAKGLEPGKHTVEVIAFDEEFNEDPTPATAGFRVKERKPK